MTDLASGPSGSGAAAERRPEAIKAVPLRHPWRWLSAVIVLLVAADAVYTIVTAPHLDWNVVDQYLFQRLIREGAVVTIELTVLAMAIGISLGITLAVMRISPNPVMAWISSFYIWFFRGTPVLVQIFFWYNLNLVLPQLGIGLPGQPLYWHVGTNEFISPFLAATLGLGFNEAAYMAEIVRAGIISVDSGQTEAAQSLGMPRLLTMRRIVLPQAMRVIIPPTGNETISMLKTTSLAFVAAVPELFTRGQQIASFNFRVVELLFVVSAWYLFMTSILTIGQYYIERYYAKGARGEVSPTLLARLQLQVLSLRSPERRV